ncbi:cation transporting ATPase C-terminal domain-containing protein [Streptomyces hirsutus]|uniref:cation transporting ATPase C-terminal domain-containing protein n=1 Tax=Streptomyces hirsutus TaxID=35620 RepID=UPI00365118E9
MTPATGLSSDEAARRLTRHGPDEIPSEPRIPVWRRVLQQLRDPLILVLLVAAALTIATGDLSDASVILVMFLGPFLGMPLPLLPAQILWINLLTHGLPGVALGAEPVAPATMRHPPRPPEESVLGAGLWPRILFMGAFIATVTLAAGVWARETGRPWQSMIFLVLGATQLGVALGGPGRVPAA